MTLILSMLNRRQSVVVSDRRLSYGGVLREDESNKAVTFGCDDARLAFAFTGLATAGTFRTNRWLLDALLESAKPDYLAIPTITRLAKRATEQFQSLLWVKAADRSLSVVCAGYVYDIAGPRGLLAVVSNFEKLDGSPLEKPYGDFVVDWKLAKDDSDSEVWATAVFGMSKAVSDSDANALIGLLREDKPAKAIVGKAVEVIRRAADSPRGRKKIGKQCSSVVLPSDPRQDAQSEYHSMTPSTVAYHVSHVHATRDHGAWEIRGGESRVLHGDVPLPIAGPKLRRNQPCWCGVLTPDGRRIKYKKCHGLAR